MKNNVYPKGIYIYILKKIQQQIDIGTNLISRIKNVSLDQEKIHVEGTQWQMKLGKKKLKLGKKKCAIREVGKMRDY